MDVKFFLRREHSIRKPIHLLSDGKDVIFKEVVQ